MEMVTLEQLNGRSSDLEEKVRDIENQLGKPHKVGFTIGEVKKRLEKPVERSDSDIKEAMSIVGIGEGPEDLSENLHKYLYGIDNE